MSPQSRGIARNPLRTRLLAAGGSLLATGGLAVAAIGGSPALAAQTADTEAQAVVENVISLTANQTSFGLTGAPGATASATSGLTATTNNLAGYNVSVQAAAGALTGTAVGNTDTIPVSALQVRDSSAAFVASSDTTAVTIHSQATKSAETGDVITANYQMEMPFVNADTYKVGLNFTVAAN